MQYTEITPGIFISRPNRFIAQVEIGGAVHTVHVKNTGRCRELLVFGARVLLERHRDYRETGRKTEYSLVAVYKGDMLVNMDSQAPNRAAEEWLRSGAAEEWLRSGAAEEWLRSEAAGGRPRSGTAEELQQAADRPSRPGIENIRREVACGHSRFDLAFTLDGRPAFMEVKGVTLEKHGVAMFPDAPTERGVKHLTELAAAAGAGFQAFILFVIQMKGVTGFVPNWETHEAFARTLRETASAGVHVLAFDCLVQEDGFTIDAPVTVRWE